jgi:hypothetical protein
MQAANEKNIQERFFVESVTELQKVNKKLAQLNMRKEELTEQIIGSLEHDHEGQKTYEYGTWKIEVKTPFVYSLNKKMYESGDIELPLDYNPIKQSIAYSIDKRLCDKYMQEAPEEVRDVLIGLIDKKPGKPSVTLKDRTS